MTGFGICHSLVDMLHHWYKAPENHQTNRVLLIDYSKAFDLVDHNIIVAKLASYALSNTLLRKGSMGLYHEEGL